MGKDGSANTSPQNEVIITFYGGEPLLNMDFIKNMVSYTKQKQDDHVNFQYMMTTNAIYLKKYIDFLSQYDFRIMASLDGSKENDSYRTFHNGASTFDIVYQNVKYVQENYTDYFKRKFSFNAVIHNRNNVPEVFSFFQQEFGVIPIFSNLNPAGVRPDMKKAFKKLMEEKPYKHNKRIRAEMHRVLDLDFGPLRQLQRFIFHYSGNTYDDYNALIIRKDKLKRLPTATCIPFSKRIFMTVNNKIFPCEKVGHQYFTFSITLTNITDCLSEKMKALSQ